MLKFFRTSKVVIKTGELKRLVSELRFRRIFRDFLASLSHCRKMKNVYENIERDT